MALRSTTGNLGACLSTSREPRWQGRISVRCSWARPTTSDPCGGADARRAAPPVVVTTGKPCNAADAPLLANPSGPGRFPLMRRCRLLIGYLPNLVGSALPEGKSAAVAATGNTQTGSQGESILGVLLKAAVNQFRSEAVDDVGGDRSFRHFLELEMNG